ncbi:zinc-dependent alcohol dehydrogenase family protein [Streptacidiphilus sp. 4-A2]|nr:zinc-dependent alcohol dehydrogenase family protein [Streptacidiphilus sp. 4-A2]
MRALVLRELDTPLELAEIATPQAGPGQVLVRIHASGVNPLDTKIRVGQADHAHRVLPAVPGLDLAGTVEAVGEGVERFTPSDEVFGMTGGVGDIQGSLAEYAAVDARLLAHKPRNLTMSQAAALPLVTITAWEGLVDRAGIRAGHKVLVHGGAGGIGHVAVQIALAHNAEVFATGGPRSQRTIKELGAIPIDYTATDVATYVADHTGGEGFDIVFDTVGGATLDASFAAARFYTGHVVSALGWGTHNIAPLSFRGATYSGVFTLLPLLTGRERAHHGDILEQAAAIAEAGRLTPRLDPRHFTLESAAEAYHAVTGGHAQGKIVIDVSNPATV